MKKFIKKNWMYIVFFLAVLIFELVIYRGMGDEITLSQEFYDKYGVRNLSNTAAFLRDKTIRDITEWSSRTIINFASNLLVLYPEAWYAGNALLSAVLFKAIASIFHVETGRDYVLSASLIFLIPHVIFLTAGWLVTTIAYYWPAVCIFVILDILYNRKYERSGWYTAALVLSTVYCANEELICAFLFVVFGYFLLMDKTRRKQLSMLEVIVLIELIWIVVCPGNRGRSVTELRWFPDFETLTLIQKVQLGFSATMKDQWLSRSILSFSLTGLLFIRMLHKKRGLKADIFALIPFLIASFDMVLPELAERNAFCYSLYHCISSYGAVAVWNYNQWIHYLPLVFFVIIGGWIMILVMDLHDYSKESIGLAVMLVMAAGARSLMGFSPTIWASSSRTFTLFYYTIVIVILFLLKEEKEEGSRWMWFYTLYFAVIAVYEIWRFAILI